MPFRRFSLSQRFYEMSFYLLSINLTRKILLHRTKTLLRRKRKGLNAKDLYTRASCADTKTMIVSLRIWLYQFLNRFGKHSIQTLACVVFLIKECSCNDGVFRFFWIKSFFQMYFFLIYIAAMTVPALCYGKGIKQLKELKLLSRQTVLMLNSKGSMYRKKRCT